MFDAITDALRKRTDLLGWTLRHIIRRGSQLYAVPGAIEAWTTLVKDHGRKSMAEVLAQLSQKCMAGIGDVTTVPFIR